MNLDYSRAKNAVRSGDDAACEGVLKYVTSRLRGSRCGKIGSPVG